MNMVPLDQFARSAPLYGEKGMDRLKNARVAVFGIGGVGGYAAEALVRTGVGSIDLFDNDAVGETNLNRQIIALHSTLGKSKVQAMEERLLDINPGVCVRTHQLFYLPENAATIDLTQFDFILDAVDTVTAKLELITRADQCGVPIISAMGAGNKVDPTQLQIADIYDTRECRLARIIRSECRKRGVKKLTVVYSTEPPVVIAADTAETPPGSRRAIPASAIFVPAAMGLAMAAEAVRQLTNP